VVYHEAVFKDGQIVTPGYTTWETNTIGLGIPQVSIRFTPTTTASDKEYMVVDPKYLAEGKASQYFNKPMSWGELSDAVSQDRVGLPAQIGANAIKAAQDKVNSKEYAEFSALPYDQKAAFFSLKTADERANFLQGIYGTGEKATKVTPFIVDLVSNAENIKFYTDKYDLTAADGWANAIGAMNRHFDQQVAGREDLSEVFRDSPVWAEKKRAEQAYVSSLGGGVEKYDAYPGMVVKNDAKDFNGIYGINTPVPQGAVKTRFNFSYLEGTEGENAGKLIMGTEQVTISFVDAKGNEIKDANNKVISTTFNQ
jgi:hypothetical protein